MTPDFDTADYVHMLIVLHDSGQETFNRAERSQSPETREYCLANLAASARLAGKIRTALGADYPPSDYHGRLRALTATLAEMNQRAGRAGAVARVNARRQRHGALGG